MARRQQKPKNPKPTEPKPVAPALPTDPVDALTGDQRNAYEYMRLVFESYGLGSLAPKILEFLVQGYDSSVIALQLQDTQEYKTRFAGNEIRKQQGLPVLDPATYLATEVAYKQAMSYYELPVGFYDDPSDFANFIGKNTSPDEIGARAQAAYEKSKNADPATRQALKDLYGLSDGDITAFFLDSAKAGALFEKQSRAIDIGAAARRSGLTNDVTRAEDLAGFGVTADQAQQGYQTIAEALPAAQKLAALDAVDFGQADLENDLFKSDANASKKRKKLASNERARFGGASGVSRGSLSSSGDGSY